MSLEEDQFRAADAKALLENPMLKGAFAALGKYLHEKALGCDPDNKEMAQRIVISEQLLAGIEREIRRYINDGVVAEIRLAELERKKRIPFFQR